MMTLKALLRPLALFGACAALSQAPLWAHRSNSFDDEEDAEQEAGDEAEKEDRYFALIGGDVYTGLGGVLRGATILSKNGVIEEIGFSVYLPKQTEKLDVSGMRVYPGLVALSSAPQITAGSFSAVPEELVDPDAPEFDPMSWDSHYGLDDNGFVDDAGHVTRDGDDDHQRETRAPEGIVGRDPELASRINDSFDPFSAFLVLSLATGITTVDQAGAAVKLKRNEIEDVLMNEGNLISMRWSLSTPDSIRSIKEKFAASASYLRDLRAWEALSSDERKESGQEKEPKKPRGVDGNVLKILTGEGLARFSSDSREELLGIARFAQQYRFKPVIFGCIEGWTVAEELGRAGAIAVVTPRARRPKSEKLVRPGGSSIENAAILHSSGVQVAIIPASTGFALQGMTGRDLLHLPTEAAFGVRGGLPEDAALAAISLIPARILGVDHRIGTLEKGKDMDAIVMDGDALHYETFVQWAVVDGKMVYDKQAELYFAHIRPRPERPQPEAAATDEESAEEVAEEPAEDEAVEEESDEEEPKQEGSDEDEDEDEEQRS